MHRRQRSVCFVVCPLWAPLPGWIHLITNLNVSSCQKSVEAEEDMTKDYQETITHCVRYWKNSIGNQKFNPESDLAKIQSILKNSIGKKFNPGLNLNSIFLSCKIQYFCHAKFNIFVMQNSIFLSCKIQYFCHAKFNIFDQLFYAKNHFFWHQKFHRFLLENWF